MFPPSGACAASACSSTAATFAAVPSFDDAASTGVPTAIAGSGRTFITDLLDTPDGGSYGPFAAGVGLHSDQLSEFGGGDGQIGIHGTGDPSSIGQAVSHGCIRVPNEVIIQLATSLPLGVPVTIR